MVSAPHEPPEVDANQFAAEFLAPRVAVEAFVESLADASPTLELVCRVSNFFAVSPEMARIRLVNCEVITDPAVAGELKQQIIESKAPEVFAAFELDDRDDICATPADELPRLPASARRTALHDLVAGEMSAAEFAQLSGLDEELVASIFPG